MMLSYPNIRLYRAGQQASATDAWELLPPADGGSKPAVSGWSEPCPGGDVTKCRTDFSSMCYFYGRDLHTALVAQGQERPIGLIGTYWGGNPNLYIHTYLHTCTYIHTYMHTYIHAYMHTYAHVHAYIHTHIHTHMYIHTGEVILTCTTCYTGQRSAVTVAIENQNRSQFKLTPS